MSLKIMHMLASPHVGGAEQVCLDLARYQNASGCDVTLVSLDRGDVHRLAEKYQIPFHYADPGSINGLTRWARWKKEAAAIKKWVLNLHPQIIHSHVPKTHLLCRRILAESGIPWIATMHGSFRQFAYAPQTENHPWIRPYLFCRHAFGDIYATKTAARIVCVARSVERDLAKIGIARSRMTTIHNGLDFEGQIASPDAARALFGMASNEIIVGAMGYFAPVKGFDVLIKAISILAPRFPQLRLYIAGGSVLGHDSTKHKIEQLISAYDLTDRIQLIGPVDPRAGFLSAIDIFVVSSRTEGMPLSLIDAMYHGKPSVITSAGGCWEAARPEIESVVFRSGDATALAAALERLIKDNTLRQSIGKAASARASGYLTLSRCAAEYEALYKEVLGKSL